MPYIFNTTTHSGIKRHPVLRAGARARGFTLLELMIVVAIVAIMASIAVPSFTRAIRSQRVLAASNALISGIMVARTEAINRGVDVTICSTADANAAAPVCSGANDWANGWLIFREQDAAVVPLPVIRVGTQNTGVTMIAPGPQVTFNKRGFPPNGNAAVIVDAANGATGDKRITVALSSSGRITSTAGYHP